MNRLEELLAQRAKLDERIAKERERQMIKAVTECRALVKQYKLTAKELFSKKL